MKYDASIPGPAKGRICGDEAEIGKLYYHFDGSGCRPNDIILATYSGLVLLSNPGHTWGHQSNLTMDECPAGTKVTLTQD